MVWAWLVARSPGNRVHTRRARRRAIVGALVAAVVPLTAARAQSSHGGQSESEQHRGENGAGGGQALQVTFNYASDLNADVSGGQSRGVDYLGRASVLFDADLDKLIGLKGATAHVSVYQIHGAGLSGDRVGNLLLVSGLEAEPATRLNQVWIQLAPSAALSLRIGKFTAAQEFMSSQTANLFVNSTFGWPDSFATDLPSGGPSYPLSAPGVRLAVQPDDRTTVRIAAFAGDPAGPGGGDPQRRERYGFNTFGLAGRPFVIGEISRNTGGKTPALTVTLGGWVHFDRFAALSNPAATPGSVAGPLGRAGDFAAYGLVDGPLWRSPTNKKRTLSAFFRASYSPSDRNVLDGYADAGITLSAPFAGRDGDQAGLGFAIGRISPALRSAARALLQSGAPATDPPPLEAVAELSYRAALIGPLQVQPNLQYVINPAGSALAIQTPNGRAPNALVVGLRSSLSF